MSIAQPTLEDVWQLFRESDRRLQETERLLKTQSAETERLLKTQSAETERLLKEQSQVTALQMQTMSKEVAELGQKTKELENLFTTQWGRLMESLVEGALVRIFNTWGIPVAHTATRIHGIYNGQIYEFDIVVCNGEIVIIVEVKTQLRPQHVKHFLKKLDQAKTWLKEYANNQIYGAMAFLKADAGAEQMVIKQNLFAIRATGDSAHIVNPKGFIPRKW